MKEKPRSETEKRKGERKGRGENDVQLCRNKTKEGT